MTLTTAGKNWLAINAGVNGCLAPSGVSFTDGDGVPFTMGTKDVVIAFIGANLGNKKDAIIIANTSYNGFVAINGGQNLTYPDATWVYNNDGHGGTPLYCAPAPHVISATLTVDKTGCAAPCTVGGTVSWTNSGDAPSASMDLQITVNGGTPTTVATGVVINPGVPTQEYAFSLTDLPVGTYEICASPDTGTTCKTVIVSPTPSNVISATLTVDPIDCVEPCTVNGTVSWTNTGGTASAPIDLQVTVNGGTPTTVATGVVVDPGVPTQDYPFSLPDLAAGTYAICASPDSGTTCKTVTVRTPANIVSNALTLNTYSCTEPCAVSGTASWTNIGGDASPSMDLQVTVNGGTPTTVATGVVINPGATTQEYPFTLPVFSAGTYEICTSPGTHCQTLTVNVLLVDAIFTSIPSGATIYMDNSEISSGTTPHTVTGLTVGNHIYKLTHADCTDATGPFTTTSGVNTVDVRFASSVRFESSPSGKRIWIEINDVMTDTGVDTPGIIQTTTGTHAYKLTMPDKPDKTGTVTIPDCRRVNVTPSEGGMGPLMMGGLLMGMVLLGKKDEDKKKEEKQPSAAKQKSAQVSRSNISNN
jgi:hypothetical protein